MTRRVLFVLLTAAVAALPQPRQPVPAQPSRMTDPARPPLVPEPLRDVGIDQKLEHQIPLHLAFRDEFGRSVRLSEYFNERPVLLALVYYQCPMLCTQILNGVESSLRAISFNPGREFDVVAVSFDPSDTPELALKKKESYLKRYRRSDTANGWHFLTGDENSIRELTDAVGFRYKYDAATKQFAHASGIMILTPSGKLSRYFYGVEYAPRDIRLGLVEASHNRIGSAVDQILLFCYHYDPATGKYGAILMRSVRFAGAAFVLISGTFLFLMLRRDVRRDRRSAG